MVRYLLTFLGGSMFGGTVGVLAMCLCVAAGRADEEMERRREE